MPKLITRNICVVHVLVAALLKICISPSTQTLYIKNSSQYSIQRPKIYIPYTVHNVTFLHWFIWKSTNKFFECRLLEYRINPQGINEFFYTYVNITWFLLHMYTICSFIRLWKITNSEMKDNFYEKTIFLNLF